jgi:hypothetical protein
VATVTRNGGGQRPAAIGCRAHTGWAAFVVVAGGFARPEVAMRGRVELADPSGRVRRNAYQAARGLEPAAAAELVEAAERIADEQAAASLERTVGEARAEGAAVHSCAVVVGAFRGARLESILASHALAHAAEGRLYQEALLDGAAALGLSAVAVPKRSIWEEGESALAVPADELRKRIDELRREIGPPWAEDQKLAALAAWIALARSPKSSSR